MGSIPGFSSLTDETLQDKMVTMTYDDKAGDFTVPLVCVLSPRT